MNVYKIQFANHNAVSVQQVDFFNGKPVEIEHSDGKRLLKSITIFADNAQESFEIASSMAKDYFSFLCR